MVSTCNKIVGHLFGVRVCVRLRSTVLIKNSLFSAALKGREIIIYGRR